MALVCLCYGVNERRIRREIDRGASTIEEIGENCDAGICCHSCHPVLDELLAERCPDATEAVARRRRRFLIV